MMARMGFEEGRGLGKNLDGRLEPIKPSESFGRLGLGNDWPNNSAEFNEDLQEKEEEKG
jgi:hypothetical protein